MSEKSGSYKRHSGLSRRTFLKTSLGAVSMIACPAMVKGIELLPIAQPEFNILDVILPGGCSLWETFWVSHHEDGSLNWRGAEELVTDLVWSDCAGTPNSSTDTKVFKQNPGGSPHVSWGPATRPLWRPDIFNRTRMVVSKHDLGVHNLADVLMYTGRRLGAPRAASLGACIQRHFRDIQLQATPYSYVFAPVHLQKAYVLEYLLAVGALPAASRPLGLKVGAGIDNLLTRNGISEQADAIFNELRTNYRDQLRWQGGDTVPSASFSDYDGASQYLIDAKQLDPLLGGDTLAADFVMPCVNAANYTDLTQKEQEAMINTTQRSLELAALMFNNGARHVTVIDGGINHEHLRDGNTPYDGHGNNQKNFVEMTSTHLFNMCKSLANIIATPWDLASTPFVKKPPKINLDNTLVRIITEFGRTPTLDPGKVGRNHFPEVNVSLMIGGPVQSRSVWGDVSGDDTSAQAQEALTPTDLYAAAATAAGVNPFSDDNLTTGDDFSESVDTGGLSAQEIRANAYSRVFGVSF